MGLTSTHLPSLRRSRPPTWSWFSMESTELSVCTSIPNASSSLETGHLGYR
uniref:Uncharacterized protein n=1 Tax=Rhizophora mucronata TaxID=61149 RepID=A0A2P2NZN0_RHIMU